MGSVVADPEWLEGKTAGHLREVLWSKPTDRTHLALNSAPEDLPEQLAEIGDVLLPPEHFIWTSHTPDGRASVCIYLFGEWFIPAPLALSLEEGELVSDYAWLLDPYRARTRAEGPLNKVTARLRRRRPRVERIKRIFRDARESAEAAIARRRKKAPPPASEAHEDP